MAWPPPTFRVDYSDTTPQQTEHPSIHNSVNGSLNADFRPKIDDNASRIGANESDIIDNQNDFLTHRGALDRDVEETTLNFFQLINGSVGIDVQLPVKMWIRHGMVYVVNTAGRSNGNIEQNTPAEQGVYEFGWTDTGFPFPPLRGVAGTISLRSDNMGGIFHGFVSRVQNSQDPDRSWRMQNMASATGGSSSIGSSAGGHPIITNPSTSFAVHLMWPSANYTTP